MPIPLLLHGRHQPQEESAPSAHYEPFGPWIVPWRFSTLEEEYRALRTTAGLIDYSTQAAVECGGADRVDFLQHILTNDLKRLAPGTGCRAALLTADSKLLADLLVAAETDALWLFTQLDRAAVVMAELEKYRFSEEVALTNHERRHAVLALQGPRSFEILAHVVQREISLPAPGDHVRVPLQDLAVWVIRHSLAGDPGVLLVVRAEQTEMAWEFLRRRGREQGLRSVGWQALNTARIEAGMPWFGIDMDDTNLLAETGLAAVVASDTKGCYIGQEIVARMQTYGSPNKKLMGLVVEAERPPTAGDRIEREGQEAGWITSACQSPALQQPIALGYLKRGSYAPGARVEIIRPDARLPATVVERPILPKIGQTRGDESG